VNVDVRYFAAAREAAGREAETLALAEGATVAVLRERLFAAHPDLGALRAGLRFAVGERFAEADTTLADGDRVALIPPVSGG
jgi:molybdopterin converting factor subunit 1